MGPTRKTFLTLAALALFLCLGCISLNAKVYLVAVGISDYPGTRNDLRLPANDARTIAWLYGKNNDVEYSLLVNGQATKSAVVSAMERQYAKAGADDIVVFFFSGHGYQGGFVAYDAVIDYSVIRRAMASCSSKHKMIFADACFSGKMSGTKRDTPSSVASAKNADVMLFLSSRSNETSIENRRMKNGFFTAALQQGLRGGADANRDRIITAKEIFDYVHKQVVRLSGNRQHPVMWGKFSDNMTVMKW